MWPNSPKAPASRIFILYPTTSNSNRLLNIDRKCALSSRRLGLSATYVNARQCHLVLAFTLITGIDAICTSHAALFRSSGRLSAPRMALPRTLEANPDAWEEEWQIQLERTYAAWHKGMPSVLSPIESIAPLMMDSSGRKNAAARFRDLCDLQADLNVMASEKCATEDFEGEWKRSKPQDRERHYVAAMAMVCEIPDMESQRT